MAASPDAQRLKAAMAALLADQATMASGASLFLQKVLTDPLLAPYFKHIDPEKPIKMVAFMTFLFGGAEAWTGRDVFSVHHHMVEHGVGPAEFERMVQVVGETLVELGLAQELVAYAMLTLRQCRPLFRFPQDEGRNGVAAPAAAGGAQQAAAAAGMGSGGCPFAPAPAAGTAGSS